MILATVGTQLPFDRLIKMLDEIAGTIDDGIFAQVGRSQYVPKNIDWCIDMEAGEFDQKISSASVIVSHAGIGTVLKAYRYAKPIILVPRRALLGEHRNDHQLATVSQLKGRTGVYVAENRDQLRSLLSLKLDAATAGGVSLAERARLQMFIAKQVGDVSR